MYKRNGTQGQPSFSMFLAFFPFPPLPTSRQNSGDMSPRPENSPCPMLRGRRQRVFLCNPWREVSTGEALGRAGLPSEEPLPFQAEGSGKAP